MSDLDLGPAIEAAERALFGDHCMCEPDECDCSDWTREAELAVEAAAPIIGRAYAVKALREAVTLIKSWPSDSEVAISVVVALLTERATAIEAGEVEP